MTRKEMSESDKRDRSEKWAGRRATAAGFAWLLPVLPTFIVGVIDGPGSLHPIVEGLHTLPLLKELPLDVLSVVTAFTSVNVMVRGFWNLAKGMEVQSFPDDYYKSASKWRWRTLGVANLWVPTDFKKVK